MTLAFDFDETLAGGAVDAILGKYGLDRGQWNERFHDPLGGGWDAIIQWRLALLGVGRAVVL